VSRKNLAPDHPKIDIQPARPADGPAIAALACQLGYPTTVDQAESRLQAMLGQADHAVLVARQYGRVVGWLHVFLARRLESGPFAELGGMVVDREHRRRGIGRSLLAAAESWSADRGVARLRVRVRSDRNEARNFYGDHGFMRAKIQDVLDKPLPG
jgi:GNAT superfamily N-acetyltransferase